MLKLIAALNRETGKEEPHAEEYLQAAMAGRPALTLAELIRGERDANGKQRPDGYIGWFYMAGKPSSDELVARIALEMKCGPRAPLTALIGIEV